MKRKRRNDENGQRVSVRRRKEEGGDGFFEERKVGLGFFGIVEESDEGSARLLGIYF
mgnify:CR=1 FL=1